MKTCMVKKEVDATPIRKINNYRVHMVAGKSADSRGVEAQLLYSYPGLFHGEEVNK